MSNRLGPEDSTPAAAAAPPALRALDGLRDLAAADFPWRHLCLRGSAEDLGSGVSTTRRLDLHRDAAAGLCGALADRVSDPALRAAAPAARRHRGDRGRAHDRSARAAWVGAALGGAARGVRGPTFRPDCHLRSSPFTP